MRENRSYQRKKSRFMPKNKWGKVKGLREKCLGDKRESFCRERSEKYEKENALKLYIETRILMDRGAVESYRTLILDRYICRGAIEHMSTAKKPWWIKQLSRSYQEDRNFLDGPRICREAIETNSRKLQWFKNAIRFVEKSSPRVSIDSYLSRAVEKLSRWAKAVFQWREQHKYECNQACYPIKYSNNILSSQNHLSIRKMSSI